MAMAPYTAADLDHSPMLVFYEMTQACDLKCQHCRADAQVDCHPEELSPAQSRQLVRELKRFPRTPLLVLTGGDPLKRWDVFDLINYAVSQGVEVAMTPSATPLLDANAIAGLKDVGLARLAVSLDGADAFTHDAFRGVEGSFVRTLEAIAHARAKGLSVQVNTTVARHNVDQLEAIANLLEPLDIALWSVFFLIPTGRAQADQRLSAQECEEVFARLYTQSQRRRFAIKSTEAPHYRRFLLQQAKGRPVNASARGPRPIGTNDGRGVMFVGHTGEIYPSGFLPIRCGQFPIDSLVDIYQKSPTFRLLRDSDQLQGKCGACGFRNICGGSRARAYALSGDMMAEEPDCAYMPARQMQSSDAVVASSAIAHRSGNA